MHNVTKQLKTKFRVTLHALIMLSLLLAFRAVPAAAAGHAITGGTNGASCNSGGYFTPSSLTIDSGDTITFSVPANDPYAGGMEIIGFPQGNIIVARGGSVTTQAITANVSYHGTWPGNTSCLKGSGTITVNAPAPPSNPPSSGGSSSGSSSGAATSPSSSSSSSTSTPTSTKSSVSTTAPAATSPTTPSTTSPAPTGNSSAKTQTKPQQAAKKTATAPAASMPAKHSSFKNVATIGGSGLVAVVVAALIAWRLMARRRATAVDTVMPPAAISPQPVSSDQPVTPPAQPSETPPGESAAEPQGKQE